MVKPRRGLKNAIQNLFCPNSINDDDSMYPRDMVPSN